MRIASLKTASSEHHHEQQTRASWWTCSRSYDNALVQKARKELCTLIFRCRLFFSLRREWRHVSNRASANKTISFILALCLRCDDSRCKQIFHTVGACCSPKRRCFLLMCGSLFEVGDISVATFFSVLHGVTRGSFVHTHRWIDIERKQTFAKIEENDTNVQVPRSRVHGQDGI